MTEEINKNGQDGEKGQEGTAGIFSASDSAAEIAKLQAQCDEYLNGWKRAKADYQNLKKETEEKQKVIFDFASANLLMEILPVYDNLKKALKLLPEQDNGWAEGIKQIKKQFESLLKDQGVEEIKTINEKFNPEFHEALSKEKKEGIETDTIIAEVSSGYLMKGKVLVPAKVIVAE
jgi:molecular chaperone GrpE